MNDLNNKFNKILLILSTISGIFLVVTIGALFFHARVMIGNTPLASEENTHTQNKVEFSEKPEEPDGHELRMNATAYQIELFEELVSAHDQFEELGTDFTLKAYASSIVRNFVADFFTLSNKESRADVGGVQFFSNDVADHFKTFAMDGFYLYLGRQIEAFGSEAMPTIESTTVTSLDFDARPIEIDEECELFDMWGQCIEEPAETKYERTIIVDVKWTFSQTSLLQIDQFQTSARFVLMEVEGEGVRIFQIEMIEACEYDMWGQCIIKEPAVPIYGELHADMYATVVQ